MCMCLKEKERMKDCLCGQLLVTSSYRHHNMSPWEQGWHFTDLASSATQRSPSKQWALREFRKEKNPCYLTVTRLQPLPVDVKMQDAGPQQLRCMWRERFQGPTSCLHLPKHVLSHFNRAQLFATPGAAPHQAPLSLGLLQASILEWVAMPSSRGSSWPRDRARVSCIAGGFFTSWATREASFSYIEER